MVLSICSGPITVLCAREREREREKRKRCWLSTFVNEIDIGQQRCWPPRRNRKAERKQQNDLIGLTGQVLLGTKRKEKNQLAAETDLGWMLL